MREFIFIFCVCLCFTPTLVTKAPMRWYLSGWRGSREVGFKEILYHGGYKKGNMWCVCVNDCAFWYYFYIFQKFLLFT